MSTNNPILALIGNPNVGKTTLFNALTGAHQTVGNWPGVTVEHKQGYYLYSGKRYEVIDLPGIYSLSANSPDERVSRDYLLDKKPDLVINIVDASNLERNLYLTAQLMELQVPLLVVLSMVDIASQNGLEIDFDHLQSHLGVPTLPLMLARRFDTLELFTAIEDSLQAPSIPLKVHYDEIVELHLTSLEQHLAVEITSVPAAMRAFPRSWLALKILEKDPSITGQLPSDLLLIAQKDITAVEKHRKQESSAILADDRYGFVRGLTKDVVKRHIKEQGTLSDRVDRIILSSYAGLPVFFGVMFLVFMLAVRASAPLIGWIGDGLNWLLVEKFGLLLNSLGAPGWLSFFLTDALGGGITTVATFIPPIFFIFLSLSILEDSGYMARAAFIADKFMRRIGLPGKAFIPLLVGFGCTVPAIMATRTLESRRDRVFASLLTPFMSCGAKLPVYTYLALLFFPRRADFAIFGLYLGGILMGMLTGLLLRKTLFKTAPGNFVMELPPYHLPTFNAIGMHTWHRLKDFVLRAGKTILLVTVLVTLLQALTFTIHINGKNQQTSVLELAGKAVTPVLQPMGIAADNWEASVALLSGLFAKEAIVGSLQGMFPNPADIPGRFGGTAAGIAYLIFIMLYSPCAAALTLLTKEHGWRWMLFAFAYLTGLAWIVATVIYQILAFNSQSWLWLGICALLCITFPLALKYFGRSHVVQT